MYGLMKKLPVLLVATTSVGLVCSVQAAPQDYFRLSIVDADTGRGVPLVEVKTTSNDRFVTDSNGLVAIDEPDLIGHNVYFSVQSHGYTLDADMFGNRGQAFDVKAGGSGQIKIKRVNIAERLYRITGAGIYRDSVLLGEKVPLSHPLLSGGVTGQDTVMTAPYKGKLYWFYGDTNRFGYPLGNFATSGATSELPGKGGLDPSVGIDLTYWTDKEGFSKQMIPRPGEGGPVWVGGVFTLKDGGQEELYTQFARVDKDGRATEKGLARFNDDKALFEKVVNYSGPLYIDGQPIRVSVKGVPYIYCYAGSSEAMPLVRVQADKAHVLDPTTYEAFTPLVTGTQKAEDKPALDRGADGKLRYAWKKDTAGLGFDGRKKAVESKQMSADEVPFQLRDVQTDAPIQSHGGSVSWNAYRQKWVMISGQAFGNPSYLGELWFSEADTPVGPWVYARKIITHNKYTFYNPTQHPFFDQDGGRLIYLEGTYTTTYSGNDTPTPRYDYNQIMYRLDLSDARLAIPSPVYALASAGGKQDYGMREDVEARKKWEQVQSAPFFAIPASRPHAGMVAFYKTATGELTPQQPAQGKPLFYALPTSPAGDEKPSPSVVPLYAYKDEKTGKTRYLTEGATIGANEKRGEQPLCRVWRNPSTILALDYEAKPLPF